MHIGTLTNSTIPDWKGQGISPLTLPVWPVSVEHESYEWHECKWVTIATDSEDSWNSRSFIIIRLGYAERGVPHGADEAVDATHNT